MKKKIWIYPLLMIGCATLLLLSSCEKDPETVLIEDSNFLNALIEAGVDTNGDGTIDSDEAKTVTRLNLYDKGISDMSGIEKFVNLDTLFCDFNELTSLDVSNNLALKYLSCDHNQLTNLDVSNNIALEILGCSRNQLTNLDVSNNIVLRVLGCHENQLSNLDVSNNTALTHLVCAENKLTSLDVTKNTALELLDCGDNPLSNLDVTNNTALTGLWCYRTELSNLDISNNIHLLSYNRPYSGDGIVLTDIPSLYEVCVWEMPFPPANAVTEVDTTGSPNVYFTTDCTGGG